MHEYLAYAEKNGAQYVELKTQEQETNSIQIQDKDVKELSTITTRLHSARVIINGKDGLAYSTKDDYKTLITNAIKLAKVAEKNIHLETFPALKKVLSTKYKINPADLSLEEKKNNLMHLDHREKYKKISSLTLNYGDVLKTWHMVTSEGRDLTWRDIRTRFYANAYAKQGTILENYLDVKGEHAGYEVMDDTDALTQEVMRMAQALLTAKHATGGTFPTIVDHRLGGVFAHEAVGHACEADTIIQGASVMHGNIGKKVGNDAVTIVDNNLQPLCNGWTPFDDDGTEGKKTILIDKGILRNYLQSRETASILKMDTTGNGRSQGLAYRIIPRMTCTYVDIGDSTFNEMLATIKDGYYLQGSMGGQTSPATGQFLFNAQYGYRVKNGELKEMVKGASLTGNILETLKQINLVGKDIQYNGGTCGKDGQWVPVSDGAPHFLINNARVGGHT